MIFFSSLVCEVEGQFGEFGVYSFYAHENNFTRRVESCSLITGLAPVNTFTRMFVFILQMIFNSGLMINLSIFHSLLAIVAVLGFWILICCIWLNLKSRHWEAFLERVKSLFQGSTDENTGLLEASHQEGSTIPQSSGGYPVSDPSSVGLLSGSTSPSSSDNEPPGVSSPESPSNKKRAAKSKKSKKPGGMDNKSLLKKY